MSYVTANELADDRVLVGEVLIERGDRHAGLAREGQAGGGGDSSAWADELNAANPGGGPVTLDSITATGYSGDFTSSSTPIPLQGVVSLVAGGTISISCMEWGTEKNDSVSQAQITATQVSSSP